MSAQIVTRAPFRIRVAFIIVLGIGCVLAGRLFYWQIYQWDKLSGLGASQRTFDSRIPARRGEILTRDGLVLAADVYLYTISVSPQGIANPDDFADELSPILKLPREKILEKLNSSAGSVILARDVPVDVGTAVQDFKNQMGSKRPDLGLANLQIQAKAARQYPARTLAAQVVGYVNVERRAAYGVEQFKDGDLRGIDGTIRGTGNALHDDWIPFDLATSEAPVNGADVILTIDSGMQRIAEAELEKGVKEARAEGGSLIVLDPKTGNILAMAVYPTADLNAYYDPANTGRYSNSAVSAQYEPGSVFKVITTAAGLDAGTLSPGTFFDDSGTLSFGGIVVYNHDHIAPGHVTLTEVLKQSLNVEAAKISIGLGVDRFYQYVRKFGFGVPTRVELAAEASGDVKSAGDGRWRDADLATNSFGQGIAVTPLQMAVAIAAVANQGRLMRPHVIQEIRYANGQVLKIEPEVVRQAVRPQAALALTQLLADSVVGESTSKAIVPGYTIAGKTGTAQIPIFGALDPRWTIASFVGYLPADDARFLILVKLDKPQSSEWGSQVASPVFASVAKQLVSRVGLPPDSVRLAK